MLFQNFKRRLVINTALLFGALSIVAFATIAVSAPKTKDTVATNTPQQSYNESRTTKGSEQSTPTPSQTQPNNIPATPQAAVDTSTLPMGTNPPLTLNSAPTDSEEPTQSADDGSVSSPAYSCVNYSCSIPKQPAPSTSSCGCSTNPPYGRYNPNVMCPMVACIQ